MNKHFILKFSRKKGRIVKRIDSNSNLRSKRTAISIGLIILSVVLLVAGVILLLIEPIKRANRRKITDDALKTLESRMTTTEPSVTDGTGETSETTAPEMTYVVPKRGNEVEGEGYDFIGETEETEEEDDEEYVVLNSIGILQISSISIRYPVWDEATQVALRYGLGHYVDSVMPGEAGNATILGHNYRDGSMFQRLGQVEIGDEVIFTTNDGEDLYYYVVSSDIVSADELIDYALGDITDETQLTLITCTYEYGMEGWRRVVVCKP